jgi:hypothetical protein
MKMFRGIEKEASPVRALDEAALKPDYANDLTATSCRWRRRGLPLAQIVRPSHHLVRRI